MTDRATFGDFLHAAYRGVANAGEQQVPARGDVGEVSRSMLRLITVMGRYLQDISPALSDTPAGRQLRRGPWELAFVQSREALTNAAGYLIRSGAAARQWPAPPSASPLARRLDGAAGSLAAGRDLLHTHFIPGPQGGRQHHSEWALAITSEPVNRAMLTEIGALAQRAAHHGANVALAPQPGGSMDPGRRRLNAACQWLWVLNASVQAAHRKQSLPAAHRELLAAIPLNELPGRRALTGHETVADLCGGVIATAERVRHLAWQAGDQPPWSPGLTITSMRQIAETSVVTSHNCELLARTLASHPSGLTPGTSADLIAAAEGARQATGAWYQIARDLRQVTTDTHGHVGPAAAEAHDLALWTGRLAYADPTWTISSGPSRPARPPEDLAARPEELQAAIAAVHHTSEALALLSQAGREQFGAAAQAGRILVPTRTLSDEYDIPRPYAPAPGERTGPLLGRYRDASQAGRQAAEGLGRAAQATGAPSRVLATARQATRSMGEAVRGMEAGRPAVRGSGGSSPDTPGPMERALTELGVTSPRLLARGADIDRASQRLLLEAADEVSPTRRDAATVLSRTPASARLANHALASTDPHAAALLRPLGDGEHDEPEP